MVLGENEQVVWQIQTCLYVFNLKRCKLFMVLRDDTGKSMPKLYDHKIIERDDRINICIKPLINNYVDNILKNFFQDQMQIRLNRTDRNEIKNMLTAHFHKHIELENSSIGYDYYCDKQATKPSISQQCRSTYYPYFKDS